MSKFNSGARCARSVKFGVLATAVIVAATATVDASGRIGATGEDPPSVKVGYADLNLASEQGQYQLKARIQRAARIVCSDFETRDLIRARVFEACVNKATAKGLAQVKWPQG